MCCTSAFWEDILVLLSKDVMGFVKEKEKGKVNQLDVGNEKDQHNSGSYNPRTKTARTKPDDQQLEQVIRTSKQQ